ncbi:MAG: nucleotidyltransferase family protein [Planctomycetia bacterium]|nr:nucleotidyltransferase family protein [Planctomycetia bacterium]
MSASRNISVPQISIATFCRKWRVREFAFFGSVLRDDFGPESDIDVLVSFEPKSQWSLWDLLAMRDELVVLFGRPVDLIEKEALRNPIRKERILSTREVIHAA